MLTIAPIDLPDNEHEVSPGNPTRVTRARLYRLSWAEVIGRDDPRAEQLIEIFDGPHRPAGAFGLAGAESQEHSMLWIGPPEVIAGFRDDPRHVVPWAEFNELGAWCDRWPSARAWLDLIPPTTWNPDGQGIVAEHDFDGAKVIVYELLGRPVLLSSRINTTPEGLVPVVTYHCTRCHEHGTTGDRYMSASPADRRMAGLAARRHMRPGNCGGPEAVRRGDNMVAAVDSAISGTPRPASTTGCTHPGARPAASIRTALRRPARAPRSARRAPTPPGTATAGNDRTAAKMAGLVCPRLARPRPPQPRWRTCCAPPRRPGNVIQAVSAQVAPSSPRRHRPHCPPPAVTWPPGLHHVGDNPP
jgi:hypothetical protein